MALALWLGCAPVAAAQSQPLGPSGLPLPRFVTLKAGKTNVRQGPGLSYEVSWIFTKPGLPVEIIQEFDNWRRIRDSEGATGWVSQGLLSGKRSVLVAPWEKGTTLALRQHPAADAAISAYLEPGVLGEVKECRQNWCRIADQRFDGWIEDSRLWGVYPGETVD